MDQRNQVGDPGRLFHPDLPSLRVDALTGLGNAFAFLADLSAAVDWATGRGQPVTLLLVDVDGLHAINTQFGRETGDVLVQEVARALGESLADLEAEEAAAGEAAPAKAATHQAPAGPGGPGGGAAPGRRLYRFGGDVFAVLLPGIDTAAARTFAREMLGQIRDTIIRLPGGAPLPISASIGISGYPDHARSAGGMIVSAERGVRRAKEIGGDAVFLRAPADPASPDHPDAPAARLMEMLVQRVVDTVDLLEETRTLAYTDPVSRLPNQRAARDFLEWECRRSARLNQPCAVLLIDGDNLKQYNDRLGHRAGDRMIRALGELLTRQVRRSDFVARWLLGDEFLIVMPGAGREEASAVAERIRAAVNSETRGWELPVTVSAGLAQFPDDATEPELLLRCAEAAKDRAKQQGKNRVVAWRPDAPPQAGRSARAGC